MSPVWCHQFSGTSPSKYLPEKRNTSTYYKYAIRLKISSWLFLSFSPFIGAENKFRTIWFPYWKKKPHLWTLCVLGFLIWTFSKSVVVILFLLCVFVQHKCYIDDTLKPPFTTHYPVCSTTVKVYDKWSQYNVISGHCARVVVLMQTAILCWWEVALACATQHPPYSSILHTNVPQSSSHTANVQMRCLVIYSMYTFDTSAKYPVIRQL